MTNGRISEKNFELLREAAIFVTVKNIRPIIPDNSRLLPIKSNKLSTCKT